jgi:hypothetical protein
MASSGKRKTTTAKLNRERKLREKRIDKQARKDARKQASADQLGPSHDLLDTSDGQPAPGETEEPSPDPVANSLIDS